MNINKIPKYHFFRILFVSFILYYLLVSPINSYVLIKELPSLIKIGYVDFKNEDSLNLKNDSLNILNHKPAVTLNKNNSSFVHSSNSNYTATISHETSYSFFINLILFILLVIFNFKFKIYFRKKRKNKLISTKLENFVKKYILKTPIINSGAILLMFIISNIEGLINNSNNINTASIEHDFFAKLLTISIFSTLLLILFTFFWQKHRVRFKYIDHVFNYEELKSKISIINDPRVLSQLIFIQAITTLLPLSIAIFYLILSISYPREIVNFDLANSQINLLLGRYSELLNNFNIKNVDFNFLKQFPYVNSPDTIMASFGIFSGFLVSIIYILFFVRWLNVQITYPISALLKNMNHISDDKSYNKLLIRTNDEFGKLTFGYNQMSEKIKNYINEIETINQNLEQKVIERTAEIEAQRDEIEAQRDEIITQHDYTLKQKDLIALQNKEITDSINYAYRIQSAILPPINYVNRCIKDNFIFYKPKDVVSGDFYFVEKIDNLIIFAAVDCTGHGVPGAMMSVIGYNLINQAVKINGIYTPSKILQFLDNGVTETLRQTYGESGVNDGMDIALCCIDTNTNTLEYAGAYNPLYLIRKLENCSFKDSEENYPNIEILKSLNLGIESSPNFQIFKSSNSVLIEIKADKLPIGVNFAGIIDEFKNIKIKLHESDMIYLFSDGFADQFGGPEGKKFKYKPLRDLLLSIASKSTAEQSLTLENTFLKWKGEHEQIDDVLIFGVKI